MDDPMQDMDNWGWQATATSLKERMTYLWKNNPIPFNVTFAVGPKGQKVLLGAHRDILAISSEVFYSMFYGPVAKPRDSNDSIVDDDVDPEAFRLLLKFIYTESVAHGDESEHHAHQIKPFPTGVELAFKTMHAAGKYGIPALYLFCRNYVLNDIMKTFRTSEGVAECGMLYALYARNPEWNNKPIIEAVWREIDAFTEAVLHVSDQVLQAVDEALMVEFLSRTSLNVSKEITLYNFAVRWARLQTEGPQKDENARNVMNKLGEVLRFSSMSEQEWLDGPVKDGLYTLDDLRHRALSVDGATSRSVHDPPAIIRFEIYEAKEVHLDTGEYSRELELGQIEIQTQTEDNDLLTQLVEKCVRRQMKYNDTDCTLDLAIDLVYKENDLDCDLGRYGPVALNKEEDEMLATCGRKAKEMKLGMGDVAVGFTLAVRDDWADDKAVAAVQVMCLVFGDGSGKSSDIAVDKLFYLGRLTSGQEYLDEWDHDAFGHTILYNVAYEEKTLDAPPRKDNNDSLDSDEDSDMPSEHESSDSFSD